MSVLVVEGLHKQFAGLKAIEDVSFTVDDRSITSLIGPNGAGKTTMINLITGILTPSRGNIHFLNKAIGGTSSLGIAGIGIRRTFQTVHLFPGLTVAENVELGRFRHVVRKQPWAALAPTWLGDRDGSTDIYLILDRLGLADLADVIATELPYGTQRKVEIARALAGAPRLILLDEPAAGMNEAETEELQHQIKTIRDDGTTVLLIEHDMHLVMTVSDKVVVMDFGRKIAEGTPSEVQANPAVITSYLGTSS